MANSEAATVELPLFYAEATMHPVPQSSMRPAALPENRAEPLQARAPASGVAAVAAVSSALQRPPSLSHTGPAPREIASVAAASDTPESRGKIRAEKLRAAKLRLDERAAIEAASPEAVAEKARILAAARWRILHH